MRMLIYFFIMLLFIIPNIHSINLVTSPLSKSSLKYLNKNDYIYCANERLNKPFLLETNNCYYYASKSFDYFLFNKSKYVINPPLRRPLLSYAIPFAGGNLSYFFNGIPFNNLPYTGKDVRVAVIDTGINPSNPWFENVSFIYLGGTYYNGTSCFYNESDYLDEEGHGTHVAGIIRSIAPNVSFIIIKLLSWYDDDIICAINKSLELNASIISMSLGGLMLFTDGYGDALYDAVNYYGNKTVFVVAAGNEGGGNQHVNLTTNFSTVFINLLHNPYFLIRYYDPSVFLFNISFYNNSNNRLVGYVVHNNNLNYYVEADPDFIFNYVSYDCSPTQCAFIIESYYDYDLNITLTSDKKVEVDLYDLNYYRQGDSYDYFLDSTPYSTLSSPANAPNAVAVGSIISHAYYSTFGNRNVGEVSLFSSQGPLRHNYSLIKPDVVAPGEQINSSNAFGYGIIYSGTSMATPFVSGVMALIKEIKPESTPQQLRNYLFSITNPHAYYLPYYSKWAKGRGLVNLSLILSYLQLHSYNYSNSAFSPFILLTVNLSNKGIAPYFSIDSFQNKNITFNVSIPCNYSGPCGFVFKLPGVYNPGEIKLFLQPILYANTSLTYNFSYFNSTYLNLTIFMNNSAFPTYCSAFPFESFNLTSFYNTSYFLNLCKYPGLNISCYYDISSPYYLIFEHPLLLNLTYNLSLPTYVFDNISLYLNETYICAQPYLIKRYLNSYYFDTLNLTVPVALFNPSLNKENGLYLHYYYLNDTLSYFLANYSVSLPSYNFSFNLSNTSLFLGPSHNITLCYSVNYKPLKIAYTAAFSFNNESYEEFLEILTNDSCITFDFPNYNLTTNMTLILKLSYFNYTFLSNKTLIYYDGINPQIYLDYPLISLKRIVGINATYTDDVGLLQGNFTFNNFSIKQLNINYTLNLTKSINTFYFYAKDLAGNDVKKNITIYYVNTSLHQDNVNILLLGNTSPLDFKIEDSGFKEINDDIKISYINLTPLNNSSLDLILNFTIPKDHSFLYAYKDNGSHTFNLSPLLLTQTHCLIYINLSNDPEVGVVLEKYVSSSSTTSSSSSGSSPSGGGGSFSLYIPQSSSKENQSQKDNDNKSVFLEINNSNEFNITNHSYSLSQSNISFKTNNSNIRESKESRDSMSLPFIYLFYALFLLFLGLVFYTIKVYYYSPSLDNYKRIGFVNESIYNQLKGECKKVKIYKNNRNKDITEIMFIKECGKGWDNKVLVKRSDGKIEVLAFHNPTA